MVRQVRHLRENVFTLQFGPSAVGAYVPADGLGDTLDPHRWGAARAGRRGRQLAEQPAPEIV
ncbi:MAG: hypothetical protein ACREJR_00940 [Candidatus Rokuibacteriota bacterium]